VANVTLDAYLSLTSRPARTIAMMAGIMLAVIGVTAAITIADTQQAQIDRRFDAQRSSFVMLQAQSPAERGFDSTAMDKVRALEPVTTGGELSIWRESIRVQMTPYEPAEPVPLIAASTEGLEAAGTESRGVPYSAITGAPSAPLVWLGGALADRLGISLEAPTAVWVQGRPYSVAGLLKSDSAFGYLNSSLVVSPDLARARFHGGDSVRFLAAVRPGSASAVGDYALAALDPTRQQRLIDVTQPDGQRLQGTVSRDLRTVGIGLGLFVGFVGMVAVANTLSMAVQQRSRELGLRSAMGWTRLRIGSLILLESAVAGVLAALVGAGVGLLGAFIWSTTQGWQLIVNPLLAPAVVLAGVIFGVLGGIRPAYSASSMSPLAALRS
jgi:putative ABC transport system permease protein